MNKKIVLVAGARPNFMKIAPIIDAIRLHNETHANLEYCLVHTGQHYDSKMSDSFFLQLGIPEPQVNLAVGSGSQAEQAAAVMVRFERYLWENDTALVVVVGDVTSTLACSIVAKKQGILLAHIEGGIRSGDMSMPEEINRIVTDSITDYFFTTSRHANNNLKKEGKSDEQIFFVGNTMIDTLLKHQGQFQRPSFWKDYQLRDHGYLVMTLHRPANVDNKDQLESILRVVQEHAADLPVVFPLHPRTRNNMEKFGISAPNISFTDPLGYLEFNYLVKFSKGVITDSGGITEETTAMGVPCITLRDNTERPETCIVGTNELVGTNPHAMRPWLDRIISGTWKTGAIPERWDGKTADRIVKAIASILNNQNN